ncbi:MAG TPA: ABC transporter ATP-binding protein [Deltaproteobacteria bacterium]|nr:ABC transporter ATP-binding protein [Deltaproteobacteria bacterium]
MSEAVIVFDDVCKSYPLYHHITGGLKRFLFSLPSSLSQLKKTRYEALRHISFEVARGESFGIIGRNGAGKSTTLGLIAGVLRPTSGTVTVRLRTSPMLELGAGFHPELTGIENIVLNGVLLGMTRAAVMEKMEEIIEFSELGEFIDQPIRVYSSGMLAKLGFSVIAHLDPEILLIDEILAVGDVNFQKKCIDKMSQFRQKGVTMFFVSHSMADVEKICDRVLWLEERTMRMIGPAGEVTRAYTEYFNAGEDEKKEA